MRILPLLLALAGIGVPAVWAEPENAPPVALIELFTSEGCSSCPPAEEVLSGLLAQARAEGRPLLALAFHVDYWDRLGWKDPFSDSAYSRRQYAYAGVLKTSNVYTPQMIVNGREEFVGSNRGKAEAALRHASGRSTAAAVRIQVEQPQAGRYRVRYEVVPPRPGAVLNAAVTEDGLVTKIESGENAGRTLRQDAVVRDFRSVALDETGKGSLELAPPAIAAGKGRVIAYLQDPVTMEVLGAAEQVLPKG